MYYPKSQIKTNKTTRGNKFILSTTRESYSGPYWETSQGKYYSGKTPEDGPTIELLLASEGSNPNLPVNHSIEDNQYYYDQTYYNARNLDDTKNPPRNPISSIPSSQVSERYFVSKTNEIKFIEVSKTEYQKFKNKSPEVNWSLFEPIKIPWRTKGKRDEVYLENKTNVLKQNIPGFELFFKGKYDKFWYSE